RVLSFQLHSAPRHLHSFPTRRSSDLEPAPMPSSNAVVMPIRGITATSPMLPSGYWPTAGAPVKPLKKTKSGRRYALGVGNRTLLDRKSTRLNSSHVKISYAVFCLKKK